MVENIWDYFISNVFRFMYIYILKYLKVSNKFRNEINIKSKLGLISSIVQLVFEHYQ